MIELVKDRISVDALLDHMQDPGAGAVVLFLGTVRNSSRGKSVKKLDYEAYEPMARNQIEKVIAEARQKWPLVRAGVVHRFGEMGIGEISVAIAVSAAHRIDAFAACRHIIDRIKEDVPIWKKEFGADGSWWVEGEIVSQDA